MKEEANARLGTRGYYHRTSFELNGNPCFFLLVMLYLLQKSFGPKQKNNLTFYTKRTMFHPQRFAISLAALLAVATIAPAQGVRAVSYDEIKQASGQVLSAVVYQETVLTSPTNRSLRLSIQALEFRDGKWTYRVKWKRTLDRRGSVYLSLQRDKSVVPLKLDDAAREGEQTVTLEPQTRYRTEFYTKGSAEGSLLLRKFFNTLPAESTQAGTAPDQTVGSAGKTSQRRLLEKHFEVCKRRLAFLYTPQHQTGAGTKGGTTPADSGATLNSDPVATTNPDGSSVSVNCSVFRSLHRTVTDQVLNGKGALEVIAGLKLPDDIGSLAEYDFVMNYLPPDHGRAYLEGMAGNQGIAGACALFSKFPNNFYPRRKDPIVYTVGNLEHGVGMKGAWAKECGSKAPAQWYDDHEYSMVPKFELQPGSVPQNSYVGGLVSSQSNIAPVIYHDDAQGLNTMRLGGFDPEEPMRAKVRNNPLFALTDHITIVARMRVGVPVDFYALTDNNQYTVEYANLPPGLTFDKTVAWVAPHDCKLTGVNVIAYTSTPCDGFKLGKLRGIPSSGGTFLTTFKVVLKEDPSRFSLVNVLFVIQPQKQATLHVTGPTGQQDPPSVKQGDDVKLSWPEERATINGFSTILTPLAVNFYAVPLTTGSSSCNTSSVDSFGTCEVSEGNYLMPDFARKYLVGRKVGQNYTWKVGTYMATGSGNLTALPAGRYVIYYEDVTYGDQYGDGGGGVGTDFRTLRLNCGVGGCVFPWITAAVQHNLASTHYWAVSKPFDIQEGSIPGWTGNSPNPTSLSVTTYLRAAVEGGARNSTSESLLAEIQRRFTYGDSFNLTLTKTLFDQGWYGGTIKVKPGDRLRIEWMGANFEPAYDRNNPSAYQQNQSKILSDVQSGNYTPHLSGGQGGLSSQLYLEADWANSTERRAACPGGFNLGEDTTPGAYKPWEATGSSGSKTITVPSCEAGRTYTLYYNNQGQSGNIQLGPAYRPQGGVSLRIEVQR